MMTIVEIKDFKFSWNLLVVPKLMNQELHRSLKFFLDASVELAVLETIIILVIFIPTLYKPLK